MEYNWKSWWSLQKNNHPVIKLGVPFLLVGLAFWLLCNILSSGFSPFSNLHLHGNTEISTSPVKSVDSPGNIDHITTQESGRESRDSESKCDLFTGDWVPYDKEPFYTNSSCSFIESHQNCMKNGRPDKDYLYWRWKPRGCDLPRIDPEKFLEFMRNKSSAFIGDSISRNHAQSFLCILSTVETAIQVYHDETYRSRRWIFPSYNFSVSLIWSPFLTKATIVEDANGVFTSDIELHLDVLDKNWTNYYNTFDYTIFSAGKWFPKYAIYYANNTALGCHHCPEKRNLTELGFGFAYRKVIANVFDHIISSNHNGMIFYRTSTPDHFEGGQWSAGGTCERKSPAKEGEFKLNEVNKILREIEMQEFEKASVKASENGVNFRIMDVSPLSLLRPDGHPGPYRYFQPFAKDKGAKIISDCLHWCLPGPVDAWNDVLVEMIVNG